MNTSTNQSKRFENGLSIHLLAFSLPKEIIKDNEEVRVSITTIPEECKQHFTIEGKKIYNSNHIFSLNITESTSKIIIVFRKVSTLQDNPIIASTTIHLRDFKELPNEQIITGMISTEIKYINLYYPLQKQMNEEKKKNVQRKVIGQMQIQLTATTPYPILSQNNITFAPKENKNNNKFFKNNNKSFFSKSNKFSKANKTGMNGNQYEKLIDDNAFCDNFLM